jgi:ribosomal protein S24E
MSYKIEILETYENPLAKRKEIKFKIDNRNTGTPNRYEVKQKLAALETADENLVFVKKIKTHFGDSKVLGEANIYENEEFANKFEPTYITIRNLPKEEREEARKQIKPRNRHRRNLKKVA